MSGGACCCSSTLVRYSILACVVVWGSRAGSRIGDRARLGFGRPCGGGLLCFPDFELLVGLEECGLLSDFLVFEAADDERVVGCHC